MSSKRVGADFDLEVRSMKWLPIYCLLKSSPNNLFAYGFLNSNSVAMALKFLSGSSRTNAISSKSMEASDMTVASFLERKALSLLYGLSDFHGLPGLCFS